MGSCFRISILAISEEDDRKVSHLQVGNRDVSVDGIEDRTEGGPVSCEVVLDVLLELMLGLHLREVSLAIIEHSDEVLELLVLEMGLANQERAFL